MVIKIYIYRHGGGGKTKSKKRAITRAKIKGSARKRSEKTKDLAWRKKWVGNDRVAFQAFRLLASLAFTDI